VSQLLVNKLGFPTTPWNEAFKCFMANPEVLAWACFLMGLYCKSFIVLSYLDILRRSPDLYNKKMLEFALARGLIEVKIKGNVLEAISNVKHLNKDIFKVEG
jgi:hypothetical protein